MANPQPAKTLYLIRHAKSEWANADLKDIDRPLNQRGYRDAHMMSKMLKSKGIVPELCVTSPAIRAMSTALIFARTIGYPQDQLLINPSIYESSAENLINQLLTFPAEVQTVFLFGHNPSITEAASLLGNFSVDEVPTCGIVGIGFKESSWKATDDSFLTFFDFPKNHGEQD